MVLVVILVVGYGMPIIVYVQSNGRRWRLHSDVWKCRRTAPERVILGAPAPAMRQTCFYTSTASLDFVYT
jgi:hypothetical protein